MTVKDRIGSKYIRYGILSFLIFSLLISVTITVSAEQTIDHNNTGNKSCRDCHSGHQNKGVQQGKTDKQATGKQTITKRQQPDNKQSKTISGANTANVARTGMATTSVIGNINLIASMGQDWYQQGIYGPSGYNTVIDGSWGWTFFDENPPSGFIVPSEKVIQRDNIYALLLDDGNNSNPISGAQVTANVTYWTYNGTNYTSNISSIQLTEDINRRGFYSGGFDFYGGTTYYGYNMGWCDGCHNTNFYGGVDTNIGYFPGNYTVSIRVEANSKIADKDINFEITPWGCEDCHGSGNRHRSSSPDRHIVSADMDSACYICHSVNDITGMYDAGNPHQNTAHIGINCIDCHTNRVLNSQIFDGVAFVNGGINNAPIPQYNYGVISLNKGTHSNLTCTDCHSNLTLSNPQGGYKSNGYIVNDVINKYDPNFTNVQQFLDYYIINVAGGGPLDVSFNWEGAANLGFYLYPPNFNPRNFTGLTYGGGSTFTNKPERYTNSIPMTGKWILQVYGYNLRSDWIGELQPPINYTINSTYPIQRKDLPSTPECNSCHNSNGQGNAYTKYEIPNWNPGYAHADTNGDGNLDVQCRLCHNSMHNIDIKNCRDCHNNVPTGHVIIEPQYSQYTTSQCLLCHGDPHRVSAQAEACIQCHGIGYEGANPVATTTLVNMSLFNTSIHQNINDRINKDYNVTNEDCWQCHYNKDMNRQNVRKCSYCHAKPSQWHGNANIETNLTNLSIR